MQENLRATTVELTADDLREIETASAAIALQGALLGGRQQMIDR
ncbi:MAG TPA: hypothetical protein VF608_00305 [Thermoanaerobaculia bacterium]